MHETNFHESKVHLPPAFKACPLFEEDRRKVGEEEDEHWQNEVLSLFILPFISSSPMLRFFVRNIPLLPTHDHRRVNERNSASVMSGKEREVVGETTSRSSLPLSLFLISSLEYISLTRPEKRFRKREREQLPPRRYRRIFPCLETTSRSG